MTIAMQPRMKEKFSTEVAPKVLSQFKLKNKMQAPRLQKIVLSVGMGDQLDGTKLKPQAREQVIKDLTAISGQKPVMRRATKSVANFKIRAGYEVGCMVTLRGTRMWEFYDRMVSLAIPRIKDFRGLPEKAFDAAGNYSFGVTEQGIFPEVDMTDAFFTHGMNITLVFGNSDPAKTKFALTEMGFPFRKPEERRR